MKEIELTNGKEPIGKVAIVDDRDYEWLNQFEWWLERYPYYTKKVNGKTKSFRMHRVIMNPPKGMVVDHINGDRLDNRRENLRVCTTAQNAMNAKKRHDARSRYKGVCYDSRRPDKPWSVWLGGKGKHRNYGNYQDEISAATRYNEVAKELYGEFAKLNDI